jgi:translation initiation factor IF-3
LVYRGKRSVNTKIDNYKINEEIKAEKVRLVMEGKDPQVVSTKEALDMAREMDLDLVEISPNQSPPVAKIIDYSKFKFEQVKKAKEAKKKQKIIHIKEIKMRPNIDTHDFDHKVRHAIEFIEKGDKVKFTLMFRGREMVHPELGFDVMNKIKDALEDMIQIEKDASQEGRNITMIVTPKPGGKKK